jgi:hypothetical protein
MYKQLKIVGSNGVEQNHIIRENSPGNYTSFPTDPDNTDYQAYLKWVEAGNTPEPADEQGA